jgi:AAA15 family ATPase/GTPase
MIIDFSVENYRSIKEMHTLSMLAANITSKYKELDTQNLLKPSSKLSILKSKAIYGANASGKSNLIRALIAFISIVANSVKDDKILNSRIERFELSTDTDDKPSFFQISFIVKKIYYRYGFEATNKEIKSEWLFGSPGKKEVPFFTREGANISVNENQFKEASKVKDLYSQPENDIARSNSLFITAVKSFSGGIARDIVNYLSSIIVISGLSDFKLHQIAEDALGVEELRIKMAKLLRVADVGIDDINRIEYKGGNDNGKNEKGYLTVTTHKKYDKNLKQVGNANFFMLSNESEGSKKMFEISPLILHALNENRVLVMDEFDARFHPLLTRKIVELFNSNSNKGSQLIFATHDTNLLSAKLLRRDQVCFVEKDKYGASHFYTLVDFKGVRNDASFEKDYVSGKYGAIPFLGDFNSIIEG